MTSVSVNNEQIRRGPGRPQNPDVARRILAATRQVVAEVGVRDASMSAIADAARCGKPSIYLRWPSLEAVIEAAVEDVPKTEELGRRFIAAVEAMDALLEVEHGRFLAEAAVLPSAAEQVRKPAAGTT
jgi:AcrR family transcriptional regulator